jgi:selenocysteine lyase/cysteine desulfurase
VIDLDRVRAETPGARQRVFCDSAGSSLPPAPVLDEVVAHLRREAEVGGYRAAAERAEDLDAGYGVFARLLDCAPEEVAFTDSATRSWLALLDAVPLAAGDRVLISQVEYGANAVALRRLAEERGFAIEKMPCRETGQIDTDALAGFLDERVKLVSLVHMPTNSGLINPVAEVAAAAHAVGAPVLLDACQSVGQTTLSMRASGVDLLSGTGRKWLRGPRGTGFLAARGSAAEQLWPRLIDHSGAAWHTQESYRLRGGARVFELFESGVAERLGLVAAARHALDLGPAEIETAVRERAGRLRTGLGALERVTLTDPGQPLSGIVTFTVDGVPPARVKEALFEVGIVLGSSSVEGARIDMETRGLDEVVRASAHYFVSGNDLDRMLAAIAGL